MSCRARAGLPGSGYQRIPQWTTVSASVAGQQAGEQRAADVGLDEVGPLELAGGGALSIPARYSTVGSRSSRRASSAPQWLATPAITTRRPGHLILSLRFSLTGRLRSASSSTASRRSSASSRLGELLARRPAPGGRARRRRPGPGASARHARPARAARAPRGPRAPAARPRRAAAWRARRLSAGRARRAPASPPPRGCARSPLAARRPTPPIGRCLRTAPPRRYASSVPTVRPAWLAVARAGRPPAALRRSAAARRARRRGGPRPPRAGWTATAGAARVRSTSDRGGDVERAHRRALGVGGPLAGAERPWSAPG